MQCLNYHHSFIVLANDITIVNYNCKNFIVQATGEVCQEHLYAIIYHKPGKVGKECFNTNNGKRLGKLCHDLLNVIKDIKLVMNAEVFSFMSTW